MGLALAFGLVLTPCAALAQDAAAKADPWQPMNRGLYSFNQGIDHVLLAPAAHAYMAVVPAPARDGVHNLLMNLTEPSTFLNQVLQLRIRKAGRTALRFAANSTVGLGGLFDVANRDGELPIATTDFGQTLARYGAGKGPYLFIPVLGPSTLRDGVGRTVDLFTNPLNWTQINRYPPNLYTQIGLLVLDGRSQADPLLKDVRANATDPYATLRSLYLQNSESRLNGGTLRVDDLPDYGPPAAADSPPPALPAPAPAAAPGPVADAGKPLPAWAYAVLADRGYERLSH